jgi:membrane protein CcdC involved in cytochrome C biogenesis
MILLYFLFTILCVGMIMTLLNQRDYINIVPWAMALILAMRELNREVSKDNKDV